MPCRTVPGQQSAAVAPYSPRGAHWARQRKSCWAGATQREFVLQHPTSLQSKSSTATPSGRQVGRQTRVLELFGSLQAPEQHDWSVEQTRSALRQTGGAPHWPILHVRPLQH